MKLQFIVPIVALALASSAMAQSHTPIVTGGWVGYETVVGAPVNLSSSVTVGNPIYGRVDLKIHADPTQAAVDGFGWLDPGPQTSIENRLGGSQGQSGNYTYVGSLQGVVITSGSSGAGMIAQITNPVDAFASAQCSYYNSCGGSLLGRSSLVHTASSGIIGVPNITPPSWFSTSCETNAFSYSANSTAVIFLRSYTGGNVWVNGNGWATSTTILSEM